jgi:Tfp pilus assembly protein FimT
VAIPAVDTSTGASTPAAIWILAVVAGIALAGLFLWLLGRRYGWSLDRWTRPFRAAVSEAVERTADLARDFWDWLRLGR